MDTTLSALERLEDQLPLRERQRALPPTYADIHRRILHGFAEGGHPPSLSRLQTGGRDEIGEVLERLAGDDLIVVENGEIVGAYPFTLESTPHRITVGEHDLNAMCSLDAVAIAPVFGVEVRTVSECAVTGAPVRVLQRDTAVTSAEPGELRIGIRWTQPQGCAAHSMCKEMVFLADDQAAAVWQGSDPEGDGIFTLSDAIELGFRFFRPLLDPSALA